MANKAKKNVVKSKAGKAKTAAKKVSVSKKSNVKAKKQVSAKVKKVAPKAKQMATKAVAAKPVKAAVPVKMAPMMKAPEMKASPMMRTGMRTGSMKNRMAKAPIISVAATETKAEAKYNNSSANRFAKGVKVVYPAHGVGEIIGIETHAVAGMELKQYVIQFEKEKMVLRVPVARAERSGLRTLSSDGELKNVRDTLLERPRSSRGMWSRRAKEYETKINSGNILSVAEVVRDLHKNVDDPERSYSERVIYENALERLAREVSAIKKLDIPAAQDYLVKTINDNNPYFIKKAAAKKAAEEEDMEDDAMAA